MTELLWLVPFMPLAGFVVLSLAGARLPKKMVALIGAGSVGISALITIMIGISFFGTQPAGRFFSQTLWLWMQAEGLRADVSFYLDPLSMIMVFVVTFVGFLIHLYSVEHMKEDVAYSRFFAWMNLFVFFMLVLVLADNMLLLYLGWEGVGLCSYLLIVFWYKEPANGYAARKAFIMTRIGDVALVLGIFLLYMNTGTLNIQYLVRHAATHWEAGSGIVTLAAFLLLVGAIGKSAQAPLHTWLPDAMAGPTPVSALIHAATMVTAGVYLIVRMNAIFSLAPLAQYVVASVGVVTMLLSGFSALAQRDIKRVLAYSTMGQVGYMFIALGVGAYSAAIFHLMVHAFFKALLFLCAGVIIAGLGHERDMFRMGGLRTQFPLVFRVFVIGAASLSALPLVTAGFYSKELILWEVWSSPNGGAWLWVAGLAGALITSLYSFRMVFLIFFGQMRGEMKTKPVAKNSMETNSMAINIPLVTLAFLSVVSGLLLLSSGGGGTLFSAFTGAVLPAAGLVQNRWLEISLRSIGAAVSLAGIFIAYILYLKRPDVTDRLARSRAGAFISRIWASGFGFDRFYDIVFVRPIVRIAQINRDDFFDLMYDGIGWYCTLLHNMLSRTQTGKLRWYAAAIAAGAALIIAMAVSL